MAISSYRLFQPGQDLSHYVPPATPVDWVVKLVAASGVVPPEVGSGFLVSDPGFGHVIFTARHVVRPYGDYAPTSVEVHTSTGYAFLALTCAFPDDAADSTDFAVLVVNSDLLTTGAKPIGAVPSASFKATLRGFKGTHYDAEDKPLNVQRSGAMLRYVALASSWRGASGGPIHTGGVVVGSVVSLDRGVQLFDSAEMQGCLNKAHDAVNA